MSGPIYATAQLTLFDAEMTDAERDAIVADFLARQADVVVTDGAPRAHPCVCEHPLLFAGELGEGRCSLCGREPRERGSNDAALGFEGTDP
jgi:hypothetical protein